jgi:hypothetical protein
MGTQDEIGAGALTQSRQSGHSDSVTSSRPVTHMLKPTLLCLLLLLVWPCKRDMMQACCCCSCVCMHKTHLPNHKDRPATTSPPIDPPLRVHAWVHTPTCNILCVCCCSCSTAVDVGGNIVDLLTVLISNGAA